jgi:hypothetical protein
MLRQKPRLIANSANDNSISGPRLTDSTAIGAKIGSSNLVLARFPTMTEITEPFFSYSA